jgi:hypothetical protein
MKCFSARRTLAGTRAFNNALAVFVYDMEFHITVTDDLMGPVGVLPLVDLAQCV